MAPAKSTLDTSPAPTLHLLIAEDNPDDLALTLRELAKSDLNLHIETVSTRAAFVDILNAQPIDIALSDFRMVNWTGIDALTEIPATAPTSACCRKPNTRDSPSCRNPTIRAISPAAFAILSIFNPPKPARLNIAPNAVPLRRNSSFSLKFSVRLAQMLLTLFRSACYS